MQFQQANSHHREVSHQIIFFQKRAQGTEQFRNIAIAAFHDFIECPLCMIVPVPSILKGFNLSLRLLSSWRFEENVVVSLAVKGRIEVNKINALSGDRRTQHL